MTTRNWKIYSTVTGRFYGDFPGETPSEACSNLPSDVRAAFSSEDILRCVSGTDNGTVYAHQIQGVNRNLEIVNLAVLIAHATIRHALPGESLEIGLGGWQTFKSEFPGNTADETTLFAGAVLAVIEKFGPSAE